MDLLELLNGFMPSQLVKLGLNSSWLDRPLLPRKAIRG